MATRFVPASARPQETTLTVSPQPELVVAATVVEFHHRALDHDLITEDAGEIRDLESGPHGGGHAQVATLLERLGHDAVMMRA